MGKHNDGLPPWVPAAGGIALAVLLLSGVGIALLQRFGNPPTQPTPIQAADIAESPTDTPTPTATPLPPDRLTLGTSREATLTHAQPAHTYTLDLTAGQTIIIEAQGTHGHPTDLTLVLSNSQGIAIARNIQSYHQVIGGLWALHTAIHQTGTYTLTVEGTPPFSIGAYTLNAQQATPDTVPAFQRFDQSAWQTVEKATVGVGFRVPGEFAAPTEAHIYQLRALQTDYVRVKLLGSAVLDVDIAGSARMVAPPQGEYSGVFELAPPVSGARLRVTPRGSGEGGYTLITEAMTEPTFTVWRGPIGLHMTGRELRSSAQRDVWVFSGQAGQRVSLSGTTHSRRADLHTELTTPSGQRLSPEDDHLGTRGGIYTLPEDGIYSVRVYAQGEEAARLDYNLTLRPLSDILYVDRPDTLTLGANVRASFLPGEPTHTYTLEALEGQRYALTLDALDGLWLPNILLRDPAGEFVANWMPDTPYMGEDWLEYRTREGQRRAVFTAGQSGAHTIEVSLRQLPFSGEVAYSLRAEQTDPFEPRFLRPELFTLIYAGELSPGQTEIGTLARADHRHDYTVTNTGDSRVVTVTVEGELGMVPCIIVQQPESAFPGQAAPFCQQRLTHQISHHPLSFSIVPVHAQTGNYTVSVTEGLGRDASETTRLIPRTPAEPNPAGYSFEGQAGQRVGVHATHEDDSLQTLITTPGGQQINLHQAEPYIRLEEDGIYFVEVGWFANTPSAYPQGIAEGYTVELIPYDQRPIVTHSPLAPGDFTSGRIPHYYVTHTYPLELPPGQRVTLRVTDPDTRPLPFDIRDSDDSIVPLPTQHTEGSPASFTPQPGESYTLHVRSWGAGPVAYSVSVAQGFGVDVTRSATLGVGQSGEGRITTYDEAHQWLVEAGPNREVNITLSSYHYGIIVTNSAGELLDGTLTRAEESLVRYEFWSGEEGGLFSVLAYRLDGASGFYTIEVSEN